MKNRFDINKTFISALFLLLVVLSGSLYSGIVLQADFNSNSNSFNYVDDPFRATSQPNYASGVRNASGGFGGSGALTVTVGGVDATPINNMSGGWTINFSLASAGNVTLSLKYNLQTVSNYEGDEYNQVLVALNGNLVGVSGNDYVAQLYGGGGDPLETGWQTFTVYLGNLSAGNHGITIGMYNNKKTELAEQATAYFDDFVITSNPAGASGILMETFTGIPGTTIASLTGAANYPDNPSTSQVISVLDGPVDVADQFGTRMRGYVEAPATGSYTFWLATDDDGELWLSSDESPANASLIANIIGWANHLEWTKYASQQSSPVSLVAGQKYYIEVLQKEEVGGDNIAVGWQGPGITGEMERPIPGYRLTPWNDAATAPTIVTQPASQTVNELETATFTVVANGTAPLTYQWQRDGADISGATGASYTTSVAAYSDNGASFTVVVSNSEGSVTSSAAVLTVIALPPTITVHPVDITVNEPQAAIFSVTTAGTTPISYQWQLNGANIAGATSSSYNTGATNYSENGDVYRVIVTNAGGSITSNPATLTVVPAPPVITTHPANQTRFEGETASFSVVAVSSAPLTYQWRRFGSYVGGNSNTYTTPVLTYSNNNDAYSVIVSNAGGSTTSSSAILTVNPGPPVIVTQPVSQTIEVGQTASFSVVASGTAPLSYQWRKDGLNIPSANSSTYDFVGATLADNGAVFSVVVDNPGGTVVSNNAGLTVQLPGAVPNSQKLSISGELLDDAGNPIGYPTPVDVEASIRLFTDASAGTEVYAESFLIANSQAITVDDGLFVARLGEGSTGDDLQSILSTYDNLWVEITIEGSPPDVLLPRTPLTSSAYSIR